MKIFLLFLAFTEILCAYELGIVTLFRNEAPYLKEWVEYHQAMGVEHFFLYNDRSTDEWQKVLDPYIESGLVEVIPWNKPEGLSVFPAWQVLAYRDGLRRAEGQAEWLAFIDIDEFILPKKNRTVTECLKTYFSDADGVYICWRCFGTSGLYLEPGTSLLTSLTRASSMYHSRNASGKSIVKVGQVDIQWIWSPHHFVLKPGAQYYNGSKTPLYFKGSDLVVDPRPTSDYLQINHYNLRDENFFQKVRMPTALSGEYGDPALLMEFYKSFNEVEDKEMIRFLKKQHPGLFKKLSPKEGKRR